ncbi:MAG: extracellular solute-binding protein [Oscillospiraceae bacterium]|nr:extracellular solute-binding protein [Oscillospiraceae bacterium]
MKKKQILFYSLFIFTLLLCACESRDSDDSNESQIDNSIIEAYQYFPKKMNMAHVTGPVHKMIVNGDLIYFCYTVEAFNYNPSSTMIVIECIKSDGTLVSQTEIPVSLIDVSIAALYITNQNDIAFIVTGVDELNAGFDSTVLYMEYSMQGVQVKNQELKGINRQSHGLLIIGQAIITENRNIVLLTLEAGKSYIYIYDEEFSLRGQMETNFNQSMCLIPNERVLVSDKEVSLNSSHSILREININTGDWGETHLIAVTDIHNLYAASDNDSFDLYIDDGTYIYGYSIDTGMKTTIFNWNDIGIGYGGLIHLSFLSDEQVSLFISHTDSAHENWQTEHMLLTRTAKSDLPDFDVIMFGGLHIKHDALVMTRIHEFNALNQDYRIEVLDYTEFNMSDDDRSGELRFLTDIITGNAPDIIVGSIPSFTTMAEQGYLLDLYPLIDADPILNRYDFFTNILTAIETADGLLPAIGRHFTVKTMIGMPDTVGDVETWTFADMLALIERTGDSDASFILFEWMTAERFLDIALSSSGNDFIDWSTNTANLNCEEFIQLLKISSRFPNVMAPWEDDFTSPIMRMLRGEQLLDIIDLSRIRLYQMYTGMLGDDIIALGMPTQDGGANVIDMHGFAISSNSKHQDAAWGFIRQFLMDDLNIDETWYFPLRLDLFEIIIDNAKIPHYTIDEDGNEVEYPDSYMSQGDDFKVGIYALSEAEERGLRSIIENARIIGHSNETIMVIIQEETLQFFTGNRSAADTARVLQNRVQTFLNE